MTLPPPAAGQSSIRSFFQPKQPTYAAPPSATAAAATPPSAAAAPPPPPPQAAPPSQPPPQQQQQRKPSIPSPPPPPPAPANAAPKSSPAAVPVPAPKQTHHPNITISPILPSHIPALRRMTARILPVRYPDSFWEPLLDPESSGAFSRVLLWNEDAAADAAQSPPQPTVIGGLVCRPEPVCQARPGEMVDLIPDALYIQSLVLNEPYRRLGLASAMLDEVCALAARDQQWACRTVCAHVWTPNQDGMDWYMARGFTKVEPPVDAYYRMLNPSDAWIVRRDIGGDAVLGALRAQPPQEPPQPAPTPAAASFTRVAPPPAPLRTPSSGPPPSARSGPMPSPSPSGTSFQNTRPETEWNDLPADMSRNLAVPGSGASSGASSRSSSTMRKKRDKRAYPAAAFGNPS